MKHIMLYKNFTLNESINLNISDSYTIDLDRMILTVYYDSDAWDNEEEYSKAIMYAAQNENDSLTDDLVESLWEHGYDIDTSRNHEYSDNPKNGWIDFHIIEIPHRELVNLPGGIKALHGKGYTEEDIEALKTASNYGIA